MRYFLFPLIGVIFMQSAATQAFTVSSVLKSDPGTSPVRVIYGADGKIYGIEYSSNSVSSFFSINPDGTEKLQEPTNLKIYKMTPFTQNKKGQILFGSSETISDSSCPGYTKEQGTGTIIDEDWGDIFTFNPWNLGTNDFQLKNITENLNARICPTGNMAIDANENLYFISRVSYSDPMNPGDKIYRLTPEGDLSVVKAFVQGDLEENRQVALSEGYSPKDLYINKNGSTIYGVNSRGGNKIYTLNEKTLKDFGTIFRIETSKENNFSVVRHLQLNEDSRILVTGSELAIQENKLYYTTDGHPQFNTSNGLVNKLDLSATDIDQSWTNTITFGNTYHPKGSTPMGLEAHENGKLYGISYRGGSNNSGTVFQIDAADDSFETIYDFIEADSIGINPNNMMIGWDGSIYGVTAIDPAIFRIQDTTVNQVFISAFYPQDPQFTWKEGSQQTQLHWKAENADTCEASGDWAGPKATSSPEAGETITIPKNGVNEFILTCTKGSETVTRTTRVLASDAPESPYISDFRSDAYSLTAGNNARFTLSWAAENATSCQVTRNGSPFHTITADNTATGSHDIPATLTGTFEFGLTCTGIDGTTDQWHPALSVSVTAPTTKAGSGGGNINPFALLALGLLLFRRPRHGKSAQEGNH